MPLDPEALADSVLQAIETAMGPVLERMAGLEARIGTLADLRDRLVAVETKAAQFVPVNVDAAVAPLLERLAVAEAKTERIAVAETAVTELGKDAVALRERVAVAEVRQLVAGPPGQDGINGKDGADGLGFDDLAVEFDGERTLALKFLRGEQTKTFQVVLPYLKYRGIYREGTTYEPGDVMTWAGHAWHCRKTTALSPGLGTKVQNGPRQGEPEGQQGKDCWTLMVKRGDNGKDLRDLQPTSTSLPVVTVGAKR